MSFVVPRGLIARLEMRWCLRTARARLSIGLGTEEYVPVDVDVAET